jgi:hypothetical protein
MKVSSSFVCLERNQQPHDKRQRKQKREKREEGLSSIPTTSLHFSKGYLFLAASRE